ncbi:hypothetical protein RJG79_02710 [Mycoplasmatota bacterium WC44]
MYSIKRVIEAESEVFKEEVIKFLENIPSIDAIDEDVVMNASVLTEENTILGLLSYEKFTKYGLIRYFIFKSVISNEHILELFNDVIESARMDDIDTLFSVIKKKEVEGFFGELGFNKVDKSKFVIDEENFLDSKYKDANIMLCRI